MEKNICKILSVFDVAYKQQAQCNVGACYFHGVYVEQSNIKAREWYNLAAAQGNRDAIKLLKILDQKEEAEEEKIAQEVLLV